jgi:hypothetical protein
MIRRLIKALRDSPLETSRIVYSHALTVQNCTLCDCLISWSNVSVRAKGLFLYQGLTLRCPWALVIGGPSAFVDAGVSRKKTRSCAIYIYRIIYIYIYIYITYI